MVAIGVDIYIREGKVPLRYVIRGFFPVHGAAGSPIRRSEKTDIVGTCLLPFLQHHRLVLSLSYTMLPCVR